jgi:hypothetical protein
MKTTLIIRHKHLYRIWFIHFVRYLGANHKTIDKTLNRFLKMRKGTSKISSRSGTSNQEKG